MVTAGSMRYTPDRRLSSPVRVVDGLVVTAAVVAPLATAVIKPLPHVTVTLSNQHILETGCHAVTIQFISKHTTLKSTNTNNKSHGTNEIQLRNRF